MSDSFSTIASDCDGLVGRFAPSPSGRMHLGNVFTFLIAWLSAHQQGGCVVLRIEDLDPERTTQHYADLCMSDLDWLGLHWEGTPVYQSSRTEAYEEAFHRLRDQGRIYPCFCSRSDWHAAAAPHAGDHIVYPGTCRNLDPLTRTELSSRKKPSWRFAVGDETVSFVDRFQGEVSFSLADDCGDCVVRRADGVFAYQLAVVVDDAFQGVNEVCRGMDLIDSAATQRSLGKALGLPSVVYAHVPLLRNSEGKRLAKRDADLDMGILRERFKSPEKFLGHLCLMTGLRPTDASVTLEQLLSEFDPRTLCLESIHVKQ